MGNPDLQKTLEICRAEEVSEAQTHRMSANVHAQTVSKVSFMECQKMNLMRTLEQPK